MASSIRIEEEMRREEINSKMKKKKNGAITLVTIGIAGIVPGAFMLPGVEILTANFSFGLGLLIAGGLFTLLGLTLFLSKYNEPEFYKSRLSSEARYRGFSDASAGEFNQSFYSFLKDNELKHYNSRLSSEVRHRSFSGFDSDSNDSDSNDTVSSQDSFTSCN